MRNSPKRQFRIKKSRKSRKLSEPPPPGSESQECLSAERLCAITGFTDRWNRKLADQGYFPPPIRGFYQKDATLEGIIRYQKEQIAKGSEPVKVEQEAFMRAKRQTAEEELARVRGLYVEKARIEPAIRNVCLHQRAVLQRMLEQELPARLVGKTTIEINQEMRNSVDTICQVFREGVRQWAEGPPKE